MTNIPQAYKYRYNGVIYIGGALPEGAELLETINRIDVKTAQTIETMDIVDPKADESDLDGKADTDLSNINTSGKSFASGLAMPSSRYIDLTLGASGSSYTAPANGWFLLYMHTTTSGSINWAQLVNWSKNDFANRISTNISNDFSIFLPVNKGDIVGLEYDNIDLSYSWNKFRFYYTEGENV